jgi:hypothetical protein
MLQPGDEGQVPHLDRLRLCRIIRLMMISFIETKLFTGLVQDYLSDDEYQELQKYLVEEPEAGTIVRGTGGVRKLRWAAAGRGKSGGFRVIYFAKLDKGVIWMLTMYPKNVADKIPAHVLREIRKEVEDAEEDA